MGANSHERIVPLWEEPRISYVLTGKKVAGPRDWSGRVTYVDERVEKKSRRKRLTPAEAWQKVYDEEGYEDGHSYSGTFGSKDGMVVMFRSDKLSEPLMHEMSMVMSLYGHNYEDNDPYHPLKVQGKVFCSCTGGKVRSDPADFASPLIPHAECKGTGKRVRNTEERTLARKRVNLRKKLIALIGDATLRQINAVYDDKWGPAAAVVGKDLVWFGGFCSS
jgi:hypothetical protein